MKNPLIHDWSDFHVGMCVEIPFKINQADMLAFETLSGDCSRIHNDVEFAQLNGFEEPVVYGALTVARLSYLLGMHLPGDLGLAASWEIHFNKPLYVDEEAIFEAKVVHLSPSTRIVKIKFKVTATSKLSTQKSHPVKIIATGSAQSQILKQGL